MLIITSENAGLLLGASLGCAVLSAEQHLQSFWLLPQTCMKLGIVKPTGLHPIIG